MMRKRLVLGILSGLFWAGSSYAAPYAIVVREKTVALPEWEAVVDTLRVRHEGQILVYRSLETLGQQLRELAPTHVCVVAEPVDLKDYFIAELHRLLRNLDDDPYGDAIWGIVTGYTAEDAMRMARVESFRVRKILTGTVAGNQWLPYVKEGVSTAEGEYGRMWVKTPDGTIVDGLECPRDRTAFLINQLNLNAFDMFVTSGHGSEHSWQLHYPYPDEEGFFRSKAGQVYGEPFEGPEIELHSTNPKIYFGLGNCYVGRLWGMDSMPLAWMHSGGACMVTGYLIPEGEHSYQLGGMPAYFFVQDRVTWPEAFYLNNQALLFDLDNETPGVSLSAQESFIAEQDGAVLYGDPGLDVRVEPVETPLYEKKLSITWGAERDTVSVKIRMNAKGTPGYTGKWGNRHPIIPLPFPARGVRIEWMEAYDAVVTDNFVLMYVWKEGDPALGIGAEREVVFTKDKD
ncbi:MAG: hypothetical protein V1800_18040 [Candidatus Latescibacterota bacterium]